ncbi:immunity 22 family protein [Bacillus paralicheniformis]|uniref:immunity 22 family protein n=1 Tax=Bacillus paralicheniformis TaxID=1648923 RepID=UPI000472989C|nr:immunity 22 family protein [Bacillus paralicheniformis]MBX9434022.1 immunity 22 family protein [Bacillus paralicheniformis]MDE1360594.1 immunity 22 family protein [Bacillus paralicheniformis]MEC2097530.1 immunity 22 family protein [Bacillus paralicheniformis]MEC2116228.1 immunity 22 family protein [Bacillus paralicheniformis]MEC2322652.1 immunity 22 family protein [Bacillus paralicheniformis]
MQKEEFVSLWVGSISSPEELEKILKTSYTEDGDFIPSIFAHSFNIERYDESVREADFYEGSSNSVSRLLEDFSYDHTIIPEFISVCGEHLTKNYNAVVLLYNFDYKGVKKKVSIGGGEFKFLGSVKYM